MASGRFDASYWLIALGVGLMLLVQSWLIRRRRAWPGVVVPAAFVMLLAYLGAAGELAEVADWVLCAVGVGGLLVWWVAARQRRTQGADDDRE